MNTQNVIEKVINLLSGDLTYDKRAEAKGLLKQLVDNRLDHFIARKMKIDILEIAAILDRITPKSLPTEV